MFTDKAKIFNKSNNALQFTLNNQWLNTGKLKKWNNLKILNIYKSKPNPIDLLTNLSKSPSVTEFKDLDIQIYM